MTIRRRRHVKAHGRWNKTDRQTIVELAISYGKTMLKCRFQPWLHDQAGSRGRVAIHLWPQQDNRRRT